jgi:RimJ/RimL family protein N-acetyltransferase
VEENEGETMKIETDRLILRPFEEKDLEELYALLSDRKVMEYEPYLPADREEAKQELQGRMASDEFLAMELKENGRMAGEFLRNNLSSNEQRSIRRLDAPLHT